MKLSRSQIMVLLIFISGLILALAGVLLKNELYWFIGAVTIICLMLGEITVIWRKPKDHRPNASVNRPNRPLKPVSKKRIEKIRIKRY